VLHAADRPLVVAVGNDGQFARLCAVLGISGLAHDERYSSNSARVAHRDSLRADLESVLRRTNADDWQRDLTAAGVPCGPINDIAQGFDLAERLGLNPIVEIDDPRRATTQRQVANPISYGRTPPTYRTAPPLVGEDRAVVLEFLGLADE
jgi:crotonobetainyl-CoA:carnitine CoA-transferase CaiB-like acyl-CoA transferase